MESNDINHPAVVGEAKIKHLNLNLNEALKPTHTLSLTLRWDFTVLMNPLALSHSSLW